MSNISLKDDRLIKKTQSSSALKKSGLFLREKLEWVGRSSAAAADVRPPQTLPSPIRSPTNADSQTNVPGK